MIFKRELFRAFVFVTILTLIESRYVLVNLLNGHKGGGGDDGAERDQLHLDKRQRRRRLGQNLTILKSSPTFWAAS